MRLRIILKSCINHIKTSYSVRENIINISHTPFYLLQKTNYLLLRRFYFYKYLKHISTEMEIIVKKWSPLLVSNRLFIATVSTQNMLLKRRLPRSRRWNQKPSIWRATVLLMQHLLSNIYTISIGWRHHARSLYSLSQLFYSRSSVHASSSLAFCSRGNLLYH